MPKRLSIDAAKASRGGNPSSPTVPDAVAKKTERSHEENQERAYIAASRRQDRSIEARVQSARMASDIHYRRTGKRFSISEDIVRKEEMYEEEEDDLPRSYRLLNPNMQTESAEFNARIEAWMTNRMAMSQYMQRSNDEWQDNHINRLFAQSFPQANQQAQQISRQMSLSGPGQAEPQSPQQAQQAAQSPVSPAFQTTGHDDGSGTFPTMSPTQTDPVSSGSGFNPLSPTALTQDGSSPNTPVQPNFGQQQSAFTAELPAEMKLMMGMDMSSPYNQNLYSQNWSNMGNTDGFFPTDMNTTSEDGTNKLGELDMQGGLFGDDAWQQQMGEEPAWDSFINDNAWSTDQ